MNATRGFSTVLTEGGDAAERWDGLLGGRCGAQRKGELRLSIIRHGQARGVGDHDIRKKIVP